MILKFAYYGVPVLREKAKSVGEITPESKQFVLDLIETCEDKDGAGLAAPQVHRSLRIFVICIPKWDEDGNIVEKGKPEVFIDPIISEPSDDELEDVEACLSVPGVFGHVSRPKRITVEATNLDGERFTEIAEGYRARAIMHENDHLNLCSR